MVVGAKVCELTDGFLWFVCELDVGILMSPLRPCTDFASNSLAMVCNRSFIIPNILLAILLYLFQFLSGSQTIVTINISFS